MKSSSASMRRLFQAVHRSRSRCSPSRSRCSPSCRCLSISPFRCANAKNNNLAPPSNNNTSELYSTAPNGTAWPAAIRSAGLLHHCAPVPVILISSQVVNRVPSGKVAKWRFTEFSLNQRNRPAHVFLTQSGNHQPSDSVLAVDPQTADRQAAVCLASPVITLL